MTRLPVARFDQALSYWQISAAFWGGWTPVHATSRPTCWYHGPQGGLARGVRWLDERLDDEFRVAMPLNDPCDDGTARCSMLWVRVDGRDQLERANRFRPRPSIVFSEGASRRVCFWPLEEVLPWLAVKTANKRIAYRLRAVQKWGDPDEFSFVAPGTCVRAGRARPVPVRVARLTTETFTVAQVVGKLRDPPVVNWWERAG